MLFWLVQAQVIGIVVGGSFNQLLPRSAIEIRLALKCRNEQRRRAVQSLRQQPISELIQAAVPHIRTLNPRDAREHALSMYPRSELTLRW